MPIYLVDIEVTRSHRVKVEADSHRGALAAAARQEHWLDVEPGDPIIHVEPNEAWPEVHEPDPDWQRDEMTDWKYRLENPED